MKAAKITREILERREETRNSFNANDRCCDGIVDRRRSRRSKISSLFFFSRQRNLRTRIVCRKVATGNEEIEKRWGEKKTKLFVWDTWLVTRITRYRGARCEIPMETRSGVSYTVLQTPNWLQFQKIARRKSHKSPSWNRDAFPLENWVTTHRRLLIFPKSNFANRLPDSRHISRRRK